MSPNPEDFWQTAERIENTAGPFAALIFVIAFTGIWLGIIFLAAWAVSITLGTGYWMTALSIGLLKVALK